MKDNNKILGEFECLDKSPFRYFLGELYGGNSLGSTIAVGNEKKRQRVYNTMFHVPWRCERGNSESCSPQFLHPSLQLYIVQQKIWLVPSCFHFSF
ncbi:Protein POLLEN DEFECTIVE IN GUIDANCE 1 [Zea mays]|uniref:Protein POLLEN DEFECTIVE IN GUIDANCE 1 n=1 Tax=Zea mays TaxID=4577 RepID=A0A1D6HKE4_MAIZE|nr:Protein POLLEN DEFECTIVE IN GUIDANCE 1 [Zea mays]